MPELESNRSFGSAFKVTTGISGFTPNKYVSDSTAEDIHPFCIYLALKGVLELTVNALLYKKEFSFGTDPSKVR